MCQPKCRPPRIVLPGAVGPAVWALLGVAGVVAGIALGGVVAVLLSMACAVALVALTLWSAHRLSVWLWGRSARPSAPRALPVTVRAWVDGLPGVWPSDRPLRAADRRALLGERPALEPSRVWTDAEWRRELAATLGGEPGRGLTPP